MSKDGKDCNWLQCNRCKYTTPAPPTTNESPTTHLVKTNEPKSLPIVETVRIENENKVNGEELTVESPKQILQGITSLEIKKEPVESAMPPQTVDIITNQITEDQFVDAVSTEGAAGLEMVGGSKQVTLQAVEAEDGTNTICMVDENGIIVQKVEQAEDGTLYVQMADGSDSTKQVLSVAEDGSVQMVEVLWDDMVAPDDGSTMVTF